MPEPQAFEVIVSGSYATALERVIAALKAEDFGVIPDFLLVNRKSAII
jgi:hypothetical protein